MSAGVQKPQYLPAQAVWPGDLAFPNHEHSPPEATQTPQVLPVTPHVPVETLCPPLSVVGWSGRSPASVVAMPKATVHKDDLLVAGQDDIGSTWQVPSV